MTRGDGAGAPRADNGLRAAQYVPLTDVDPAVGQHLLTALGRARIAAYLSVTGEDERRRLFVAAEDRADARTIVASAVRGLGDTPPDAAPPDAPGTDTDAAFDALVADWRIDTVAAVREAERDLTREDADWRSRLNLPHGTDEVWLDEDHYVPPPPPPLPRLAAPTVLGIVVLVLAIAVLAFGSLVGLAGDVTLVLGIGGLVVAAGIFFTRVRDHHRDEDDDGSAV